MKQFEHILQLMGLRLFPGQLTKSLAEPAKQLIFLFCLFMVVRAANAGDWYALKWPALIFICGSSFAHVGLILLGNYQQQQFQKKNGGGHFRDSYDNFDDDIEFNDKLTETTIVEQLKFTESVEQPGTYYKEVGQKDEAGNRPLRLYWTTAGNVSIVEGDSKEIQLCTNVLGFFQLIGIMDAINNEPAPAYQPMNIHPDLPCL